MFAVEISRCCHVTVGRSTKFTSIRSIAWTPYVAVKLKMKLSCIWNIIRDTNNSGSIELGIDGKR